jgi:hypothetical protein
MTYKDAIAPSAICAKNKKMCYCPYFLSVVTASSIRHISEKYMYIFTYLFFHDTCIIAKKKSSPEALIDVL